MTATIGRRLAALRLQRNMSRDGLAASAGVSKDTIEGLEWGKAAGATLNTLTCLAGAWAVPVAVLLGEQPIPDGRWVRGGDGWAQVRAEVEQLRGAA